MKDADDRIEREPSDKAVKQPFQKPIALVDQQQHIDKPNAQHTVPKEVSDISHYGGESPGTGYSRHPKQLIQRGGTRKVSMRLPLRRTAPSAP